MLDQPKWLECGTAYSRVQISFGYSRIEMKIQYFDEKEKLTEVHINADTPEGVCFDGMYMHAL
jgi:hypothetical protein